ncbi:MAG: hypothetical protein QHH26_01685 [Armatimonadota bacterium]|nr:hypothetical protein [Armatimonadota bacterium]
MFRTCYITLLFLVLSVGATAAVSIPPVAWSGDGAKIAVASQIEGAYGIHIFDPNGCRGNFIRFHHEILAMKWPASDQPIAVLARQSDGKCYLWLLNISGIIKKISNRAVYIPKIASPNYFSWSPDGTAIAFASNSGGSVNIYRIRVDSGREQKLTSGSMDFEPTWSPDGSKIAFTSRKGKSLGIYLVSSAGGSARCVIDTPDDEENPTWSPDSTRLAFLRTGGRTGIYTISISGSGLKPIAIGGSSYRSPVWSSTGKWISYIYGKEPANIFATSVAKSTGFGPHFQASFDRSKAVSTWLRVPTWSPNHDRLVYATYEDGRLSVRIATLSEKSGPAISYVYTAPPIVRKRS